VSDPSKSIANTMWGGRFSVSPDALMQAINASIDVDRRMAREDVALSQAHAAMLAAQEIISTEDAAAIADGLRAIEAELEAGTFPFRREFEDVHMNIEARLKELIGAPAGRLHTARSRNDQVVTSFRLWLIGSARAADAALSVLQATLVERADAEADTVMPGFTHLQTAQPVTLGHHLMAYVEMLARDRGRIADAARRANECPLGAAALAGTGFPIDREATASALGFAAPMANSMDAVGSRDFAMETVSALAIALVHMSRLAEEIVLWTSPLVGFARLSDAWSTGSSIMPQKRNPDAAELIRAKAARVASLAQALMMVVKALPLTYAKDLQDDKAMTFEAFDAFLLCARALEGMMASIDFDRVAMRRMAGSGHSTATDLADWLVRERGLPFREAHHVTGAIVKRADAEGVALDMLPLADMQAVFPGIDETVYAVLTVERSVASRDSLGGTAPVRVREQVSKWRAALERAGSV
jgi:argininosuccinate lyase